MPKGTTTLKVHAPKRIDDDSYLWEVLKFDHSPLRPPRADLVGEVVFAEEWVKLLASLDSFDDPVNSNLTYMLGQMGHELSQRAATVCASFITWLGTNVGNSFLFAAERAAANEAWKERDYVGTWAGFNLRRNSNGGIRQLESILAPEGAWGQGRFGLAVKNIPELSAYDYEVAEHLAAWLGSERGQKFIKTCHEEIERRRPEHQMRFHLANNLNMPPEEVARVMKLAEGVRSRG